MDDLNGLVERERAGEVNMTNRNGEMCRPVLVIYVILLEHRSIRSFVKELLRFLFMGRNGGVVCCFSLCRREAGKIRALPSDRRALSLSSLSHVDERDNSDGP